MFQTLDILNSSAEMARHAGARQAITAANMANADTPGYRAMQMAPFAEIHDFPQSVNLRTTRQTHLQPSSPNITAAATYSNAEPAPNGNSVSLEQEMINAVEIQREHARALAIYKHSLDVLRISLGKR